MTSTSYSLAPNSFAILDGWRKPQRRRAGSRWIIFLSLIFLSVKIFAAREELDR